MWIYDCKNSKSTTSKGRLKMTSSDIIHSNIKQPKKPVIVAICGKSATGKDTLAN